jgi:VWFA-related protein
MTALPRRTAAVGLAVAFALVPVAGQQQPAGPVLRASVDQVVVDVVVTDQHGGVVPGLTAADFEVFERGRPQAIGTFSEVSLPLVRPAAAVAPPAAPPSDVRTNQRRPEGRIYVLVLDDHHVTPGRTGRVRDAARDFLNRQVQPGDLVAVVTTTGAGGAFQDFTEDAALAGAAVEHFAGRLPGETAALQQSTEAASAARANQATAAQLQAAAGAGADTPLAQSAATQAESAFGARNADPMAVRRNATAIISDGAVVDNDDAAHESLERAAVSLRTLRAIADGLAPIGGRRKAVLFFSEGLPISPRAGDLVEELARVTAAAARANVTIYAFDPRGLDLHMGSELMATGVSPSAQLQQRQRLSVEMLRSLAEETGGTAAVLQNDLAPALARVADESSHYYLIGYVPADAARDGRYRSIEVRVKRPGLRVSARRGYVAPDDRAPAPDTFNGLDPELSALVRRPMSTPGLPIAAMAVPFLTELDNVSVTVEIAAGAIAFEARDGRETNVVDLAIVPIATGGRVHPMVKAQARLELPPEDAAAVRTLGLRMVDRLTLPPGEYQVHVAARERGGGASGSVIVDLVVPERTGGLTLTPLVVSTTRARRVPSANRDDRLVRALGGGPPTAARAFTRGETLSVYAEVIDGGASVRRDVELVTIVRDAAGRTVVNSVRPDAAGRVEPGRPFPYAIDLPLRTLAPGRYVLRVEARAAGAAEPVARELRFEIAAG